MEVQFVFVSKLALLFILAFIPFLHAILMKARYGIRVSGPRSILRNNLYDFGLMATTAVCTAGIILVVK